ncbi:MAG: V-type ATP synthase subunit I [Vicinamibacterales bacterium]
MIVRMSRIQVLGPRRFLRATLRCLHTQGVLQLSPALEGARVATAAKVPLAGDELASQRRCEDLVGRLAELLLILPSPRGDPTAGCNLPDVAHSRFPPQLDQIDAEIRALARTRTALLEEQHIVARYQRLLTALRELLSALQPTARTETVGILVSRQEPEALPAIEREIARITRGAFALFPRDVDLDHTAVLLTVPSGCAPELSRLLFERGVSEIKVPQRYADRPLIETLLDLVQRSRELPGSIAAVEAELERSSERWHAALTNAHRQAQDCLARFRAVPLCGETQHAFVITGWAPRERCDALVSVLETSFHGRVTLLEHPIANADRAAVPVILRNRPLIRPFELLLSLLSPPRYGSVDPTPFIAVFFPFFIGLMLADVGYGAIALLISLVALKRAWGGDTGRQVAIIATASSVSTVVFGILFGECFGELGARFGLHPILFDRTTAVLTFLALSLALGVIHITLGLGLGLWTAIRHRDGAGALVKASTLVLVPSLVLAFLGYFHRVPDALGAAAMAATGLLSVALVLREGILAPIELVKLVGHVLSYARLMALGMASVMLANVANQMAVLFPTAVGVPAALLLHAVNVLLVFSPVIQALRLHYVEFFDKFYEDGGVTYRPFALAS